MLCATALLFWQRVLICDSRLVEIPLALIKGRSLLVFFFPFLNQRGETKVHLKVPVEPYKTKRVLQCLSEEEARFFDSIRCMYIYMQWLEVGWGGGVE